MRYQDVCIEGLGYVVPEQVVSSAWIEEQLAPVFGALEIPPGQIERLTGIRERRWWDEGVRVAQAAARAGERALRRAGVEKEEIGCIVNTSVLRDYLEPSTAAIVHQYLGLPATAVGFDVGNACLGFLNGMTVVANMIEVGQIDAGLVVSAEGSREGQLATIERLLGAPPSLAACFENLASFTIGSGAVAMVLTSRDRSRTGRRLVGGAARADTRHHELCVADKLWMKTNSSRLLSEGLKVIRQAWAAFQDEIGWEAPTIDRVFTHQVAEKQRVLGLQQCGFALDQDYPTLHYLGNIASVSTPLGLALADDEGVIEGADRLCLAGVGSGINSMMLAVNWGRS